MESQLWNLRRAVYFAACLAVAAAVAAQPTPQTSSRAGSWTTAKTWDGQPDLSGDWTNDTYTPLERPAELAGKEFFTPEEAEAFVKSRIDRLNAQSKTDIHYDDAIWQAENYAKIANRRTSIIIEPRDGKLPPLTPLAQSRLAEQRVAQRAARPSGRAQSRSLGERCISWGNVGPPMMPPTYNANLQIMQTRGLVLIRHEMMHDARMIYLDGRPHPPPSVQWMAGHSVGHWEGRTLVVDTTNFTSLTNFRGSPQNTRQDIFASERLHVVERFARTGADTIHYSFTVEDSDTWTAPWSGEMEIRRTGDAIYEYACHEGNYGLANILSAAQTAESGRVKN